MDGVKSHIDKPVGEDKLEKQCENRQSKMCMRAQKRGHPTLSRGRGGLWRRGDASLCLEG